MAEAKRTAAPGKLAKTAPDTPAKVEVHPVVSADAAVARAASRLGIEYFLRTAQLMSREDGRDTISGMVMYAIIAGNVGHLDWDPAKPGQYASMDDVAPQEARRPVSVLAVADSLGLPYETTRRHVSKLQKLGRCVRVKGGIIGLPISLQGPAADEAMLANLANLRRLFRGLKRAGADFL